MTFREEKRYGSRRRTDEEPGGGVAQGRRFGGTCAAHHLGHSLPLPSDPPPLPPSKPSWRFFVSAFLRRQDVNGVQERGRKAGGGLAGSWRAESKIESWGSTEPSPSRPIAIHRMG